MPAANASTVLLPDPPPDSASLAIPHDHALIDAVVNAVIEVLERHQYPKASLFAVRLSLHEGLTNAFRHGHQALPPETPVKFEYRVEDPEARFTIEDRGPGFDPASLPDPTAEENLEKASGRGIMLIRAYMSSVTFNDRGNRVQMVYRRPAGAATLPTRAGG